MRIGAAHRELSPSQGQLFLATGYTLIPRNILGLQFQQLHPPLRGTRLVNGT